MFFKIILIIYMRGGGLTITKPLTTKLQNYDDLDFRYTFNVNRIKWIKNIYPYSYLFLEIPGLIEWDTFEYNGICQICKEDEEDEEDEDEDEYDGEHEFTYTDSIGVVSSTSDLPKYIFFGGCAYEILSRNILM